MSALKRLRATKFVLDGEIVIPVDGDLSFDQLLMRIHPAASLVEKLSRKTPCLFIIFDLLVDKKGKSLKDLSLQKRRQELDRFAAKYLKGDRTVRLSPFTLELSAARKWFHMGTAVDCVVAKRRDLSYQSGTRNGMEKIKKLRTADCAVGGFRYREAARFHRQGPGRTEPMEQKSARLSGSQPARGLWQKCSSIISPAVGFATARNFSAGALTRSRQNARSNKWSGKIGQR